MPGADLYVLLSLITRVVAILAKDKLPVTDDYSVEDYMLLNAATGKEKRN